MIATLVLLAAMADPAPSNPPSPAPSPSSLPRYLPLPDEENWKSVCRTSPRPGDPLDALKCLPLSADPNRYVTLGADVRVKYEHFFNKDWNAGNNGYLLERELLDVDLHEDRVRTFLQLEHATATNPHAPIDPTWRDDFATTSAYAEYEIGGATGDPSPPISIRAGRQLLAYGSGRMVDDRYGLNTEQPFDGVRVRFRSGAWRTDLFALKPVNVAPYAFDDLSDRTRSFSGVYATRRIGANALDVYGFVDQRQAQFSFRGTEPEVRDTVGVRYATTSNVFDSDTEIDEQFGSFGGATIAAYAIETSLGYDFGDASSRFRVGLGGGVASGDRDPKSSRDTLFRAPYPTGLTFGIIEANGNENTAGFTPSVSFTSAKKLTLAIKDYFYYRQSVADGVYSAPGFPLRAPSGSKASPIGNLWYVSCSDALDRHLSLYGAYARYLIGPFLAEAPQSAGHPSVATAYYTLWFDYKI